MDSIYYMYEQISAVRKSGSQTEIIHSKTDKYLVPQSFDQTRAIFARDCKVMSPKDYIKARFGFGKSPIFIEFQSMDSMHEGETVLVNPADIMSYGGTSNDGGVHIATYSGLLFVIPIELKAFAHAHEQYRRHAQPAAKVA